VKPKTIAIITTIAFFGIVTTFGSNSSETNTTSLSPRQTTQTEAPASTQTTEARPEQAETSTAATETAAPAASPTSEPSASAEPTSTQTSEPTSAPTTYPTASNESDLVADEPPPTNETDRFSVLLAGLDIEPEVTSGYDRDLFKHWVDADRDGCNAREEVLIIESLDPVELSSTCRALSGRWLSRFDGVVITESSRLDIDHMVPLKEAWDSGANAWSAERREAFANDLDLPEALIAVSASSNRSKSARDPAEWLPTASGYVCQYVKDWMSVKTKWQLSVDQREFEALRSVSLGCVND